MNKGHKTQENPKSSAQSDIKNDLIDKNKKSTPIVSKTFHNAKELSKSNKKRSRIEVNMEFNSLHKKDSQNSLSNKRKESNKSVNSAHVAENPRIASKT